MRTADRDLDRLQASLQAYRTRSLGRANVPTLIADLQRLALALQEQALAEIERSVTSSTLLLTLVHGYGAPVNVLLPRARAIAASHVMLQQLDGDCLTLIASPSLRRSAEDSRWR